MNILLIIIVITFCAIFKTKPKRALLYYMVLKLPLDQLIWQINLNIGFTYIKGSEFITVCFIIVCWLDLINKKKHLKTPGFILFLYVFAYIIQIFREPYIVWGLRLFFQMVGGIIIGLVFAKYFKTKEDITKLIKAVLFGAVIVSILDIPAIFSGGQFTVYYSKANTTLGTYLSGGVGNYYSADSFAHGLIVSIPVVLLGLSFLKQKWQIALCLYFLIFSTLGVFSSALRAGWLSTITALLLWMIFNKRFKILVISILSVFILISIESFSGGFDRAYSKIEDEIIGIQAGNYDTLLQDRSRIWSLYWQHYLNYPLFDKLFGSNNFWALANIIQHDPHNDFLFTLLRMGLIGLVLLLALYGSMGFKLIQHLRRFESYYDKNVAFTALLCLIMMIIPAFFRAGFVNPNYQTFFWTFCFITYNLAGFRLKSYDVEHKNPVNLKMEISTTMA